MHKDFWCLENNLTSSIQFDAEAGEACILKRKVYFDFLLY